MLYIVSLVFIHFITGNVYLLTTFIQFSLPLPPATDYHKGDLLWVSFSHSVGSLHFVGSFLCYAETFQFDVVPFVYFCFCFPCLRRQIKNQLRPVSKRVVLMVSSRSFMVLGLFHLSFLSTLNLFIPSTLILCPIIMWQCDPVSLFCMQPSTFPTYFVEEAFFSPM